MTEPKPTWRWRQHPPLYGAGPVVWDQTIPDGLELELDEAPATPPGKLVARLIALSAQEVRAITVAARLFNFAGDGVEPETGMRYADVRPILAALAAKLEER